jgi:uncharacterized membrane protein YoaK (UPF0700 family)
VSDTAAATPGRAPSERALALTLLAAAGYLDAVAFLALSGIFVAFMSGNTTILGQSIAYGHWHTLAICAALIIGFFAGNILGNVITRWGGPRAHHIQSSATIAWVALGALLTVVVSPEIGLPVVAIGSGLINTALSRSTDVHVGLTYVTGTLVKAAHQLVYGIRTDDAWQWTTTVATWLVFACGAMAGGFGYRWIGVSSIWIAVVALVIAAFLPHRSD